MGENMQDTPHAALITDPAGHQVPGNEGLYPSRNDKSEKEKGDYPKHQEHRRFHPLDMLPRAGAAAKIKHYQSQQTHENRRDKHRVISSPSHTTPIYNNPSPAERINPQLS
jgi:hypothetical protein